MLKALFIASVITASGPQYGPSDEMFDELKNAPSEEEASSTATDIWAAWLESGSAAADLVMQRAVEAQNLGDLELAHELLDRVIAIQPTYAEAYTRRAALFLVDENFPEALRDLNEAIRLEPRHFGAWTGLGRILETLGAKDEALEAYREALKIYPTLQVARAAESRLVREQNGQGL
ncbi:tetratricopeptide repeat protein [Henriciella algicola]|jgi:tetratricopeptide (TPR) repeat protein|uniref:Tetratricopeptide repeat protein n=1 Tax=Henriciella algicola TaxID=1608422 RepID=A0A399RJR8_9PROT|nr:tetratricopeptide repeat protein [Henriciella algicola]RIJ31916.1 tetratricopeptide repeat protein [Henriciella algicola]